MAHFEQFWGPGLEIAPGGLQKAILSHFGAQGRKWPKEPSRRQFRIILGPRAGNCPRRLPESHFEAFSDPARKAAPRRPFGSVSKLSPENGPWRPPRRPFWSTCLILMATMMTRTTMMTMIEDDGHDDDDDDDDMCMCIYVCMCCMCGFAHACVRVCMWHDVCVCVCM